NNLGSLLRNEGDLTGAVALFRHAIKARPALIQAHINLGNALRASGDVDAAAASLEQALALDSDNPEAHWNYAHVLLLRGRFKEGWAAYEWRAKCEEFRPVFPAFPQPRWDGGDLGGKTVLIFAEQGYGDAIQFVRYVPIVGALGGTVVLQCRPPLERLFAAAPGIDRVVTEIDDSLGFELQAPLLSLPHLFETDLDSIPDAVPYLRPPAGAGDPLSADDGLKVGIVWAGNPHRKTSREYSVALGRFGPLLETDGCAFFSLQVGPARNDIAGEGFGDRLADLGQGFGDFADTAAAIQQLDLVITVDTAVAHLAGALGKPVWTLLACVPEWRWLLARDDSPWYPTMRLFRQPAPGDWESVFAEVAEALRRQAAAAGGPA
ncbi:MAG: tetratricopeptide repeat protein, partial [Rhodospirillales bacterium]